MSFCRAGTHDLDLPDARIKNGRCRFCNRDRNKRNYPATSEHKRQKAKERQESNPALYEAKTKYYRLKNAAKNRLAIHAWNEKFRKTPQGKIRYALSGRIWQLLAGCGGKKTESTLQLLGCSLEEFKICIEAAWLPGMSWENYGFYGWHLDHIRPCASFDLTDPEQQRVCFHYMNFQPLWAADNLRKGAKWQEPTK